MLLSNKTAVVTGSNRGIGKKIVEIFSENGADVFACARNLDENFLNFTEEIKYKTKRKIFPINLDLEKTESIKNAFETIKQTNININILVNNAAAIHTAIFQMTSIEKLKEIFDINFFSQSLLTQYISKLMIKKKSGSIVYISSSSAIDSNEGRSAYSASKAALISQSKTLSKELGVYNIRVNSIAPGLTETDMMYKNTPEKILNEYKNNIPLKRYGKPEEIAKVALFLASDLSSYVTGQTLRADGGM